MFTCPRGADGAFQGTTRKASIGFHVSYFRLDGALAAEINYKPGCQTPACAADQHASFVDAMAAIATVDNSKFRALVGLDLHLLQCRAERMAIVGVAGKAARIHDKALVQRGGDPP